MKAQMNTKTVAIILLVLGGVIIIGALIFNLGVPTTSGSGSGDGGFFGKDTFKVVCNTEVKDNRKELFSFNPEISVADCTVGKVAICAGKFSAAPLAAFTFGGKNTIKLIAAGEEDSVDFDCGARKTCETGRLTICSKTDPGTSVTLRVLGEKKDIRTEKNVPLREVQ